MFARRFRLMLLLVFLASLPASVSGDGGLPPGPGTRGVQVTREVPFASETLEAVRSRAPAMPAQTRGDRAIPRHRIDPDPLADSSHLPAPPLSQAISFPAPAVAPRAPALDSGFPGLGDPPPGEDVIPPDTMGAAGPNHRQPDEQRVRGVRQGNRADPFHGCFPGILLELQSSRSPPLYGLHVKWVPGGDDRLSGEVRGGCIYIYEETEKEALNTLRHEFFDYAISNVIEPYKQVTNMLIAMINEEAYRRKEGLVEKLCTLLSEFQSDQ